LFDVFLLHTYSFGAIGEWEIYLNTGAVNKILDEIDHYFSEKKRHHGLTAYELKAMQVNLILKTFLFFICM
jgi:hypothetical protein